MSKKTHIKAMKKARKQLKRTRDLLLKIEHPKASAVVALVDILKKDIELAKIERDGEKTADANGTPAALPA